MATITQGEQEQIEQANASGKTPVVFIHGLWLLPSSWQTWVDLFEEAGYAPLAPGWPDDPETVEEARANPQAFAGKGVVQVADHFAEVIGALDKKPAIVGHSFGGLIAQILAGRGLSAASVAVDPAPFKGVLPLPIAAIRSTFPVLGNPPTGAARSPSPSSSSATAGPTRSPRTRRDELYERYQSPRRAGRSSRRRWPTSTPPPRPRSTPRTPTAGRCCSSPAGGPHGAAGDEQRRLQEAAPQPGRDRAHRVPDRGHSLTIDHGWREVAENALAFVKRFGD